MTQYQFNNKLNKCLVFEAEDVNDPDWEKIINILEKNNIKVFFANDNFMNFQWEEKE